LNQLHIEKKFFFFTMSKFQFPPTSSCLIRVKEKQSKSLSDLVQDTKEDLSIEVIQEKPKLKSCMTVPAAERSSQSRTPRENSFLMRISQKTAPRKNSRRKNKSCDFLGKLQKNIEAGNVECYRVGDGSFRVERQLSSKDLKNIEALAGSSADIVVGGARASTGSVRKPPKEIYRLSAGTHPRTCWVNPKIFVEDGKKNQESALEIDVPRKSMAASDDGNFEQSEILKLVEENSTLEKKVQLQKVSLDILSEQKEKLEGLFKRQNEEIQNKNRSIQTLSLKLRWISGELAKKEQQFAKKNEIIDIQGQFIDKLEEEIALLNQQLQRNSIVPRRRSQDVQHLNSEYRRISLTTG